MDDMTTFERQLSGELRGLMGPVRPVDDLAVFDAVAAANQKKGWGLTMFSVLKLVAASVILTLFGGFLLTGILTTQREDEINPAAVTQSPPSTTADEAGFPTGTLVSVENPNLLATFNDDGTGAARDVWMGWDVSFIYATHGNLYTEMWNDADIHAPVTYYWDLDGEDLTLELWGEDPDSTRNSTYADNTWRHVEDPLAVVVAPRDIEIGEPVYVMMGFIPAAEAGPDVFTAGQDVLGRIAAVPIKKGQPITPEMIQPPVE